MGMKRKMMQMHWKPIEILKHYLGLEFYGRNLEGIKQSIMYGHFFEEKGDL